MVKNMGGKKKGTPQPKPKRIPTPSPQSSDDIIPGHVTPITTPEESGSSRTSEPQANRTSDEYSMSPMSREDSPLNLNPRSQERPGTSTSPGRGGRRGSVSQAGTPGGRGKGESGRATTRSRSVAGNGGGGSPGPSPPNRAGKKDKVKGKKKEVPKKRRYRPGTIARREIRKYQTSSNLLIPRLSFQRVVREMTFYVTACATLRFQKLALEAVHEAAEAFIVGTFENSYLLALHAKRVTLKDRDIQLALRIRGDFRYT